MATSKPASRSRPNSRWGEQLAFEGQGKWVFGRFGALKTAASSEPPIADRNQQLLDGNVARRSRARARTTAWGR